ncbi:MAG TPA: substrate-binding domain-containing protein [Rhodocyclaceae bacterium]|nr:substrate-binding domain-containing protein [Rhodocyclaceae bacterium]
MNLARFSWLLALVWMAMAGVSFAQEKYKPLSLNEMQQVVANASKRAPVWNGPVSGPAGRVGMSVAVICEDLRNGGVLGVAKGIGEALGVMGWRVRIFDAHGTSEGREKEIGAALAMKPDGVILVGSDAKSLESRLTAFAERGIPLVGWHIGPVAGKLSSGPVAMNVSTDPLQVARITAMAAIVESRGHARAVIFTDSSFEIAMAKANAMAEIIKGCQGCTLLEVRDVPISQSAHLMPAVTRELQKRHEGRWTHALAINDIYFDYLVPELTKTGKAISLFSAGDGSSAAFLRIQARLLQGGTVAEPLNLQGWQLVDELNRLLSRAPVSGYVVPVHLVTPENIAFDGGRKMIFDPDNGYRDIYRRIWKR